jgi:magnesium transporter
MAYSIYKIGKTKLIPTQLGKFSSKQRIWIDCVKPKNGELEQIGLLLGISLSDIKSFANLKDRPRAFELKKHTIVLFGIPVKKKHFFSLGKLAIFLTKTNSIITIHNDELPILNDLKEEKDTRLFNEIFSSSAKFAHYTLDAFTSHFFEYYEHLEDSIEKIEKHIFSAKNSNIPKEILKTKKSLLKLHKLLLANREVVLAIEKNYVSNISKKELLRFRDLYNDIVELIDIEETNREVLTGSLDIYLTSASNELNITIKKLTSWGALILLPTFITGLYGMNFRFMPELDWKYGYIFSLGLMLVTVLILYGYFKRNKFL